MNVKVDDFDPQGVGIPDGIAAGLDGERRKTREVYLQKRRRMLLEFAAAPLLVAVRVSRTSLQILSLFYIRTCIYRLESPWEWTSLLICSNSQQMSDGNLTVGISFRMFGVRLVII